MASYTKTNWVNGTTAVNATNMNKIENALEDVYDMIYPVGSIYLSVNSTNPSTLFGGSWTQLKDRFLLGAGNTYTNNTTGGEATHTLTVNEMPSHTHSLSSTLWGQVTGYGNINATATTGANTANLVSGTVNSAGGDEPHNNMPPYLVVYMWKRTA